VDKDMVFMFREYLQKTGGEATAAALLCLAETLEATLTSSLTDKFGDGLVDVIVHELGCLPEAVAEALHPREVEGTDGP
jgi:hypothetical protein